MVSVVIPCLNEEAVLPQTFLRVTAAGEGWPLPYEVILVDDGSTDGTWERIVAQHRRDERWKGIRLARNFGHQAALGAGLAACRGDAVVVLDADLQDPPELVDAFLERWQAGYDVVYGVRTGRPEGWLKRVCYAAFYWLLARTAAVPLPRDAGDFCLMDRKVVRVLRRCGEQRPFWRGLRAWTGFRQVGVPYTRHSRQAGQSQYSFRKLLQLADDGFWSLSNLPARLLTWLAVGGTAVVALAALWPGAAMVFGCAQLLGLALLGRYLGRIYDDVRRRPRWLVADRVGLAAKDRQRTRPRRPSVTRRTFA
jgi:dolichol-phosphate mannosyltransferase